MSTQDICLLISVILCIIAMIIGIVNKVRKDEFNNIFSSILIVAASIIFIVALFLEGCPVCGQITGHAGTCATLGEEVY